MVRYWPTCADQFSREDTERTRLLLLRVEASHSSAVIPRDRIPLYDRDGRARIVATLEVETGGVQARASRRVEPAHALDVSARREAVIAVGGHDRDGVDGAGAGHALKRNGNRQKLSRAGVGQPKTPTRNTTTTQHGKGLFSRAFQRWDRARTSNYAEPRLRLVRVPCHRPRFNGMVTGSYQSATHSPLALALRAGT